MQLFRHFGQTFVYLQVKISSEPTVRVISSFCECKAGTGHCSHMVGLLYMASHYTSMGYKSVPPVVSRTSAPQQWHVPSRAAGLSAKMVDTVVISKVKPPKRSADSSLISKPKRGRVFEGVPFFSLFNPEIVFVKTSDLKCLLHTLVLSVICYNANVHVASKLHFH